MANYKKSATPLLFMLASFLFAFEISAEIHNVTVGGGGTILAFNPQNITIKTNDTVVWYFSGGNHNVVQSDGPTGSCSPSEDGFRSLTSPPEGKFEQTFNQTKGIIFYFCAVQSHCASGMWGIIRINNTDNSNVPTPSTSNTASGTSVKSLAVGKFGFVDFRTVFIGVLASIVSLGFHST
ncbi:9994_t:CDS:2 [Acaulospora morrowiae]|uniref:9994_t:CDS:1 n=1 Tax=Acaulospora morrowiae TaxID=94023 RepID=A0A9N9BS97_9GLOM|nr:9994_t:CDS:2 [Acaulospora morrowiae]